MNTVTNSVTKSVVKKVSILATLLTVSAMAMTSAKAEQLVSLENAVGMMVKQQASAVFNQIQRDISYSIEEGLGNFNINSSFKSDKGMPKVQIREVAQVAHNKGQKQVEVDQY